MRNIIPTNRRLELVSETLVGSYRFSEDGTVSATLGEKDGAVFAPILEYRVTSDNSIELLLNAEPFDVWTEIQMTGDTLHLNARGRALAFQVLGPASQ